MPRPHTRRILAAAAAATLVCPVPGLATTYDLSNTTVDIATAPYTADDTLNCTAVTFTSTISNATLPAALNLLAATTVNTTTGVTLAGPLSGTGAFQKFSTGALTLTAASPSFAGPAYVAAGATLHLTDPAALGPSSAPSPITLTGTLDASGSLPVRPVFLSGGTLSNNTATPTTVGPAMPLSTFTNNFTLAGSGDLTFSSPLPSAQSLTKSGAGTATYATPTAFSSGVTVSAGTLRLGVNAPFTNPNGANVTVASGATLDLNGFNSVGAGLTFNAGANFVNNNTAVTSTVSNFGPGSFNFGGAGDINMTVKFTGMTKVGTGTVTLSGGNGGFAGTLNVNAGTVKINNTTALGNSASSHFNLTPGNLDLNGFAAPAGTYFFNAGAVINDNTTATSTIAGSVTFNAAAGSAASFGGNGNLLANVPLPSNLDKFGNGTLTLSQSQSFSHAIVAGFGKLRLSPTASYGGSLTIFGTNSINAFGYAALDLNGLANPAFDFTLYNNAAILNDNPSTPVTLSNSSVTFPSVAPPIVAFTLGGDGTLNLAQDGFSSKTLNKVGAGLLTLPNYFASTGVNLRGGTLQVETNAQLGPSVTFFGGALRVAPLYNAVPAAYTFTPALTLTDTPGNAIDAQRDTTFTNTLTGTGPLAKLGTCTLTLNPSPAASRTALAVQAGTLRLRPTDTSGPTPLSSLSISPGATLDILASGVTIDSTPADTVRQYLANHQLITTPAPDATHALGYAPVGSSLLVQLALKGDANLDGQLDADDFALVDEGFATGASAWYQGDFNYDGLINNQDYLAIDSAYLTLHPSESTTLLAERESQFGSDYVSALLASVPEPSLLSSILYPLSSLLLTRRRSTRPS